MPRDATFGHPYGGATGPDQSEHLKRAMTRETAPDRTRASRKMARSSDRYVPTSSPDIPAFQSSANAPDVEQKAETKKGIREPGNTCLADSRSARLLRCAPKRVGRHSRRVPPVAGAPSPRCARHAQTQVDEPLRSSPGSHSWTPSGRTVAAVTATTAETGNRLRASGAGTGGNRSRQTWSAPVRTPQRHRTRGPNDSQQKPVRAAKGACSLTGSCVTTRTSATGDECAGSRHDSASTGRREQRHLGEHRGL